MKKTTKNSEKEMLLLTLTYFLLLQRKRLVIQPEDRKVRAIELYRKWNGRKR